MPLLLHMVMTGVWGMAFLINLRRLLRLACVTQLRQWEEARLRISLNRIWWWLGQSTFWQGVRLDCIKAIEITLVIFALAWGMSQ